MMKPIHRSADPSSPLRPNIESHGRPACAPLKSAVERRGRGARAPIGLGLGLAMLLALLLTPGCQTSPNIGESNTADLSSLRTAPEDWDHAFDSNDAAKPAALYAEDAISMPENAPTVRGRRAIQAEFEKYFAQYSARHETFVDEILTHQDWAIERGRFTVISTPKPSGPQSKLSGRHVVCRRKINGTWLIAWEIWNTEGGTAK